MSGHSKWSQIKHKKGAADQQKAKLFGKFAIAIANAGKDNPDPATNMQLKSIIEQARKFNVPNENIERALEKLRQRRS